MRNYISTTEHYDHLIEIGNDPFNDDEFGQRYMERWTGENFFDLLELNESSCVLEIGVGTGRLAEKVMIKGCMKFTGIDLSKDTILKAKANLLNYKNVELINKDVITHKFDRKYDVVYSALTFMHIPNKYNVLHKISEILNPNGVMVISFFNVEDVCLDFGTHQVELYPNNIKEILESIEMLKFDVELVEELKENGELLATIIKVRKLDNN